MHETLTVGRICLHNGAREENAMHEETSCEDQITNTLV